MTRKDFVLIANVLANLTLGGLPAPAMTKAEIAEQFADALLSTNPAFDTGRFMIAATKEG